MSDMSWYTVSLQIEGIHGPMEMTSREMQKLLEEKLSVEGATVTLSRVSILEEEEADE